MSAEAHVTAAIDVVLARAERRFDARIRELGGTPTPSPAQVERAAKAAVEAVAFILDGLAATAIAVGQLFAAWGESITSRPHDPEPQPSDGPDYHAEHAAWRARNPQSTDSETGENR